MQDKWAGRKVDNKTLFDLYPGNPSKQAGKVAGLPESMREGGYLRRVAFGDPLRGSRWILDTARRSGRRKRTSASRTHLPRICLLAGPSA